MNSTAYVRVKHENVALRDQNRRLRTFVDKMWMELDDAADAVGPVPELVEQNLRAWSKEAYELFVATAAVSVRLGTPTAQRCDDRREGRHRADPESS
jgi:hypothetical protein